MCELTDQCWLILKLVFRPTRAWLYKTIQLCPYYTGWYAFQSLSPASESTITMLKYSYMQLLFLKRCVANSDRQGGFADMIHFPRFFAHFNKK